jgi:molybdate transport system substrate-binding protein
LPQTFFRSCYRASKSAAAGLVLVAATLRIAAAADGEPLVAVAANMSHAMTEIAETYEAHTGEGVRLVFGSSGSFASQILQGAPFEIFVSADEGYPARLAQRRLTAGPGRVYAIGRIALLVPEASPLRDAPGLEEALEKLQAQAGLRIAIANPKLAPYGRAAVEVLDRYGLWDDASGRIALGENVAQAVQYTLSGAVAAGIVPWSDARLLEIKPRATAFLIPTAWHTPIRQAMVVLKFASAEARAFYAFVAGPEARVIIERHGYLLPSAD